MSAAPELDPDQENEPYRWLQVIIRGSNLSCFLDLNDTTTQRALTRWIEAVQGDNYYSIELPDGRIHIEARGIVFKEVTDSARKAMEEAVHAARAMTSRLMSTPGVSLR